MTRFATLARAIFGDFAGTRLGLDDNELVARFRRRRETKHFDRCRWAGVRNCFAAIVLKQTDAAPFGTGNDDVAHFQRAAFDENRRDRAAAAIELRFDDRAFGGAVGIGFEIEQFGLKQDRFLELFEPGALGRGDFDGERIAAHVFDLDFVLQQLGLHAGRIGIAFVDLVDRDDDGNLRGLGVRDRFDRLRHDAVIGGDDEHHKVRDLRTARAHGGERRVAGRVEEGDLLAALQRHLVSADVLGDAAGFAGNDVGLAQCIEQRSFAVVDMAHDGDDRGTRHARLIGVFRTFESFEHVGLGDALHGVAVFRRHEFGGVGIDRVVDGRHHAVLHQNLDDVDSAARHAIGEFGDRDGFRNRDVARTCRRRRFLLAAAIDALKMAAERGDRTLPLIVARKRA